MSTHPPDATPPVPAWVPLDARQRRVLGVLIEKAKTTPAAYPMSVNAIVVGCNQKNNRDPVTAYDEADVEQALRDLEALGAVSEVDWLGRVPKYKHHAYEWLGVSRAEAAVMTELLLRGAQALGDLRARAARMEPIADLAALKPLVDGLLQRRLIIELTPAGRGQLVSHGLHLPSESAELRARYGGAGARAAAAPAPRDARAPALRDAGEPRAPEADVVSGLRAEIGALRDEVARLRALVEALAAGGDGAAD